MQPIKTLILVDDEPNSICGAVKRGDIATIRTLLDAGTSIDSTGVMGGTPLYIAAMLGRKELVRFLIQEGADVNFVHPAFEASVLMEAVWTCSEEIIHLLVDGGANVHITNWQGVNALSLAARRGDRGIVNVLLEAGAVLRLNEAAILGDLDSIHALVAAGADINERVWDRTPLVAAANHNHQESVDLLRSLGAKVYDLREAAAIGDPELIRKMVLEGHPVDDADNSGGTGLMIAAMSGKIAAVHAFLECGADPDIETDMGYTAWHWAVARGQPEAAAILRPFTTHT